MFFMAGRMTGTELKSLRSCLGLTQAKLAEAVGVVPNTLARWERGEIGVPGWAVERLHVACRSGSSGSAVTRPRGVVLDPHHGAILSALDASLDPLVFEACATELLRRDWPGLVAVRGGQDDGYDGAVADSVRSEPFPLVVTTAKDLKGNLRRSLGRARRKWATVDRALFATSRRVTPSMRRKLEVEAREMGVTLRQVYDQDEFANRLYREPVWCKKLLGVTGRPRALSPFPVTRRPVLGDRILGRERETRWLRERRGDCLLVGAPGSGKTFLLRALVLQGQALFQVATDREQVANDLRELRPAAVIIDDAHVVDPDEIARFLQIRQEVGSDVRIIAASWPGTAPAVRDALRIPSAEVLHLDLIDADTMIEIIKSVGLAEPDELLRVIRRQADGRPGLAATLAHLCLAGDVRRAASGEALVDQLAPQLGRMLDVEDATRFLAPFALGGDAGVRLEPVAERLRRPIDAVGSGLARLAEAGIVLERPNRAVSVEPPPMRWMLVRRAFFDGAGSLQLMPFLSIVENREDAIRTLIGARSRGASVPELEEVLERSESSRLWSEYASLGPREARHVIERCPARLLDIAGDVLEHVPETVIPETVIPLLLGMVRAADAPPPEPPLLLVVVPAADAPWPEPPLTRDPLDILKTWTTQLPSDRDEWFHRRSTLLRAADRWCRDGGDAIVALRAACIALRPESRYATTDPGRGRTVRLHFDTLSRRRVEQLAELWPTARNLVRQSGDATDAPWRDLLGLVSDWARYPVDWGREIPDETRSEIKRFTKRMLLDLAHVSRRHPGLQHVLKAAGEGAGLNVDRDPDFEALRQRLDPDFEALHRRLEPDEEVKMMDSGPPDGIVEDWERRSPEETARALARIESEGNLAGISYPRWSPQLCKRLAERVSDPAAVSRMFIKHELPADLVRPFVLRAARSNAPRWPELVRGCLDDRRLRELAIYAAVTHAAPPPELLSHALAAAGDFSQSVHTWCLRDDVPPDALLQMFRSTDVRVAAAAAIGHWCGCTVQLARDGARTRCSSCGSEVAAEAVICWMCGSILNVEEYKKHTFANGGIPARRLHDAWREAILRAPADEMGISHDGYWLGEILSNIPRLAEDWLVTKFGRRGHGTESWRLQEIAVKIVSALDSGQRARVLAVLRSDCRAEKLVRSLVGDDVDLYRGLLENSDLVEYHLAPLADKPCGAWRKKALVALDRGYSVDDVTGATLGRSGVWSGPPSAMWADWRQAFETLLDDADPRIKKIGRRGADMAGEWERRELESERRQAIRGL